MKHSITSLVIVMIVVASAVGLWFNRQAFQDWLSVRRYQPSSEIVALADRAKMSDRGRFMFYASEPVMDGAETFNDVCERREMTAAVLGCYRDQRIFIYRVSNSELDGIEETTASHEMLHAAWERFSQKDRDRLSEQLEQAYQRVKTPELEERMSYYDRQQPGERTNELHSILGTEQPSVGDELEKHYKTYFDDRQAVVALHQQYQTVFSELEERTSSLKKEIETISSSLNRDIAEYNNDINQLNAAVRQHNKRLASVDRTDSAAVDAYNARRIELQAEQSQMNQRKKRLDEARRSYDNKLLEYNKTVLRSHALADSIDSLKTPANQPQ